MGIDLGTSMTNMGIMVIDPSSKVPNATELVQQDVHIRMLRDFPNTSSQWADFPTRNCPSEILLAEEDLDAAHPRNRWGWRARVAYGSQQLGIAAMRRHFDNFKANLGPDVWSTLDADDRCLVEKQI